MKDILNNKQDLSNNTASQLIGLEISEARKKLGNWWVLENQNTFTHGSRYCESINFRKASGNIKVNRIDETIPMSLCEWLCKWFDTWIKPHKSASTARGYEIYINNHIIPAIGSIKLDDLSEQLLQDFFDAKLLCGRKDGRAGGMSKQTLTNMRFMLKASMEKALDENLISQNFMNGIKITRDIKKEMNALRPEEEAALIKTCKKSDKLILFGIIISLRIGVKIGELLALKWSDLDLENKKIYIRHTLCRCVSDSNAKNKKSTFIFNNLKKHRIIDECVITDEFVSDIMMYKTKTESLMGYIPETVITAVTGLPVDSSYFSRLFKQTLQASIIDNKNYDIIRNTFAVRCFEKGFTSAEIKKYLGYTESSKRLLKLERMIDKRNK